LVNAPSTARGGPAGPVPPAGELVRPGVLVSLLFDVALAPWAYAAGYWLRFQESQAEGFLPLPFLIIPWIVAGQVAGLLLTGAYLRRQRLDWLLRVVAGVGAGTLAGSALVLATKGFEGISRGAFIADAILFSLAAVGWRCAWVLIFRARRRAKPETLEATAGDLIDRSEEMTTIAAVVRSLYSYRELLRNLVVKDLKLKYRGSVFGFLWSLANPLVMVVVYTIAFTYIMGIRTRAYVLYLMLGQLAWTFFASSALMSTGSIVDNAGLLKSVRFPRAILPIATVLFNLAQYLLTASVLLPVLMIIYLVRPVPAMLAFPVFVLLQALFVVGLALILSTITVFLRDVRHLLEVGLAVLFWMTPIVYELNKVPNEGLRLLILLSPMSSFVVAYQDLFFYRVWPSQAVWMLAAAYAAVAVTVGAMLVLAFEDRFTEQL
jgi:lipopolysaccharide transport system permease protein